MDPLIVIVEQLVAERAAGLDRAAEILGSSFSHRPDVSTPYFDVYAGVGSRAAPAISHIEVRVPKGGGALGMVIVDVNTRAHCLDDKAVTGKFGTPRPPRAPSPRQPADMPVYHEYSFNWGELRFGMERKKNPCCKRIVADFIKK